MIGGSYIILFKDTEAMAKPTPVPGKPALVPGATLGRDAGTPVETRPDRWEDARPRARVGGNPDHEASHSARVRRTWRRVRKSRRLGSAALAMSLVYVIGGSALGGLRHLIKFPRRA